MTGPKLLSVVGNRREVIDGLLRTLFTPIGAGGKVDHVNGAARTQLAVELHNLGDVLKSDEAFVAAWRDFVKSCETPARTFEEVSFRRDTVWAIAKNRRLDLGSFGLSYDLRGILSNHAFTVGRVSSRLAGEPVRFNAEAEPAPLTWWERIALCEKVICRPPVRGDCVVWLRLAPASLPHREVQHGQVTFYQAAWLAAHAGHPEWADHFTTVPSEVLAEPDPNGRIDEIEWENEWNMVYARVSLPDIEIHEAEPTATTLIEGLRAINNVDDHMWVILRGRLTYVNGRCRHREWGPKTTEIPHFYPQNDWMGRDISLMFRSGRHYDSAAGHRLHQAINMSTALKSAAKESPEAAVMAAVRAIEHVNSWTTGGSLTWDAFARKYLKKSHSRVRLTQFLRIFTQNAVDGTPNEAPGGRTPRELRELRAKLYTTRYPDHKLFHTRAAVDNIAALHRIYQNHWLARGLQELDESFSTGPNLAARLEMHCRRFDSHLGRLRRLRNAAIHGGPVSDAAVQTVHVFAQTIGRECLNEALGAMLTSEDIATHMNAFRVDLIGRYDRIASSRDIDALFIDAIDDEIEPES